MRPLTIFRAMILAATSLLAGACGNGGDTTTQQSSARGVIVSASDCVSFGEETVQSCARAIEQAVASHEATAAHNNLQSCESEVGAGMCERAVSGKYRPRLSAFLVTLGGNARAEPLYPAPPGTVGFRTAGKATLAASDHSLGFSRLAVSVAETQAASAPGSKSRSMF